MLITIVGAVLLAVSTVGLVLRALRDEYLVVLRWPKQALFVIERRHGGQYRIVAPSRLPLALVRYVGFLVGLGVASLRQRVFARSGGRMASSVGVIKA